MIRRLGVVAGALAALLALPGTATADVLFDPADADDLAATLAEAAQAQPGVCYGWDVTVDNVGRTDSSVGSNFGAGNRVEDGSSCDTTIVFQARITWTSESSESDDSASYSLFSSPNGPSTSDLDSLEVVSDDGLAGENPDIDVYKAVSALPLLAADAGVADPIEASPAPESEAAADGAQPTDSPGSDFWRQAGGMLIWAGIMIIVALALVFWALSSRKQPPAPVGPPPEHIPPEWYDPTTAPGSVHPRGERPGRPPQNRPDPETRPEG